MEKKQNSSKKIRTGDTVFVIAGNAKGQRGQVLSRKGDKVVVKGLNLRKKHVKRSEDAPKGRIVEMEAPIHISNLANDLGAKLKVRTAESGERHFVYKKENEEVIYRSVKKPK